LKGRTLPQSKHWPSRRAVVFMPIFQLFVLRRRRFQIFCGDKSARLKIEIALWKNSSKFEAK
jgi:hypothetical protein